MSYKYAFFVTAFVDVPQNIFNRDRTNSAMSFKTSLLTWLLLGTTAAMLKVAEATTTSSNTESCDPYFFACVEDAVCDECYDYAVDGYNECITGYSYDACNYVYQRPCCLSEVSAQDCLSNELFVAMWSCYTSPTIASPEGCTAFEETTCDSATTRGSDSSGATTDTTASTGSSNSAGEESSEREETEEGDSNIAVVGAMRTPGFVYLVLSLGLAGVAIFGQQEWS